MAAVRPDTFVREVSALLAGPNTDGARLASGSLRHGRELQQAGGKWTLEAAQQDGSSKPVSTEVCPPTAMTLAPPPPPPPPERVAAAKAAAAKAVPTNPAALSRTAWQAAAVAAGLAVLAACAAAIVGRAREGPARA